VRDLSSTLQKSRKIRGRIQFFRIGARILVPKFAFGANLLFPTVMRYSCFAMA